MRTKKFDHLFFILYSDAYSFPGTALYVSLLYLLGQTLFVSSKHHINLEVRNGHYRFYFKDDKVSEVHR